MVKSLKILILTTFYPPAKGGIQTYTFEIARNLEKIGHKVTVFALSNNGIKKIFSSDSFKLFQNDKKISLFRIFSNYDIIFASSWFPSGIIGLVLSRLFNSKFFISAHGNEILYPKKYPFMNKFMKWCYNSTDKIFSVSSYTKKLLIEKGVDNEKIIVIPNGTDPIRFNSKIDYSDIIKKFNLRNKKIIFSVSRLVERKNFGIVIEILNEIIHEIPDVMYIIGGTGPMKKEWGKIAIEYNVEKNVKFVGYIPEADLPKYYALCNVFIMPSIEIEKEGEVEGFGITFLEANACGKPVIGSRSGGISDAIVDGETGILVNPRDHNDIKNAIFKILKNPIYANKLGMNGRVRVEKELSWNKIAEKINEEMIYD